MRAKIIIDVLPTDGARIDVTTPVAEPGPLIAMKLQAVMSRTVNKQGTDLLDIVRLNLRRGDPRAGRLGEHLGVIVRATTAGHG